jgi:hypothetical protein
MYLPVRGTSARIGELGQQSPVKCYWRRERAGYSLSGGIQPFWLLFG